jgi:hypothetical protein
LVVSCYFKSHGSLALIESCSIKSTFSIACGLLQVEAGPFLSYQIKKVKVF